MRLKEFVDVPSTAFQVLVKALIELEGRFRAVEKRGPMEPPALLSPRKGTLNFAWMDPESALRLAPTVDTRSVTLEMVPDLVNVPVMSSLPSLFLS